jgi:alpha-mannosidase
MPSPRAREVRPASRSILRRAGRAAMLAIAMVAACVAPARAAELRIDACQCLAVPGEPLDVRLFVDNPGEHQAAMLLALHTPDDEWRFYSPAGLIPAPAWLPIPARMPLIEVPLLDLTLEPDSLPFGHHPLVGPFRFELVALLFDAVTFELLAPVAANWFEFLPAPPAPPPAGPGTLHLVVHQHNELAWLEREDVYLPLGAAFVRDAIAQADRDPRHRFVVDQMPVLERFRADFPALVPRLRALLDAGAAEVSGGHLVESDLNLLSGESIARQAIYGQRYLESQWGRRARGAWHLDAFGHPHQMPQLTKKAGMDTYTFARGVADLGALGGSEFHWESPDGSRVLAHYMPHFYQLGREIGAEPETNQELNEVFALLAPEAATPNLLAPVGADVGEHVFNDFVPEAIDAWNALQAPGVLARISTPSEFFADVEASGVPLAVAAGVEFQNDPDGSRVFPGVDAARIEIKKTNARLEQQLLDVEKLATLAWLDGRPYPEAELEAQGIALALNQTHDYLPGSGVDEIYEDADAEIDDLGDRFAAVAAALDAEQSAALDHLRARIDTTRTDVAPRTAIVVFNTMAWPRDDLVRIALADPAAVLPARLVDARGAEIPYQILAAEGGAQEIAFVAAVPATGWATYWLVPGIPSRVPGETGAVLTARSVALGGFSVDVDAGAFVNQIRRAASGTPLLAAGGVRAGDVGWFEEKFGNAYEIDPLETGAFWTSSFPQTAYVLEGPVLTRLLAVGRLANASLVVREVRLVPALERIEFATTLYWADANRNVRVRFPFAATPGAVRTEGVPYGHFERPDGDFPALGWFDLGSDARGISVLNRGLFGHRLASTPEARTLDVTLLRSLDRAVFGDRPSVAMLEHGIHRADYAIVPREGSWRDATVPRHAAAWSAPLIARETAIHVGALAPERAHLELEAGSDAVVTVFQRSGNALVVRLYETGGIDSTHALRFPTLSAASMTETDLLGDPVAALAAGSRAVLHAKPEEIVTIRLDGIANLPDPPAP